MESVLEFQNISKYFPGVKALDRYHFRRIPEKFWPFGRKWCGEIGITQGSEWGLSTD